MAFAQAEPDAVSLHRATREEDHKRRGYEDVDRFVHRHLLDQRPGLALARNWTSGHDEQAKSLSKRVHELERLLRDAAQQLKADGNLRMADRLMRQLR